MSEYQYYEFRAIDRPLAKKEMEELRAISTRAEITSVSFTNTYHWGNLKADPDVLVDRYFDAFVYVANWGTRRLMFRIPRKAFDAEVAKAYCDGEQFSIEAGKDHVILTFWSREEEDWDEWTEGEAWMPSLIAIRDELMRGDLRALYIGWLATLDADECDADECDDDGREPPVPPGLGSLSAAQSALAEFLRVDPTLIEVAASGSAGEPPTEPSPSDVSRWVKGLPEAEKEAYLLRFLAGEGDLAIRAEVSRRFRESTAPKPTRHSPKTEGRTIAEILAGREALVEAREREEAGRAAEERTRREREQAEARSRYLEDLAGREQSAWEDVETMIARKLPKEYDRAVALLVDLRDLAERSGHASRAEARIVELRRSHAAKRTLIQRLDEKKLGK
ncbi:MAG: hypothetical protein JWN86_3065 [Planctomycetota bacterium]|nr:hypothetical protein [Planctomycetota bacterium]